MSIIIIHGYVYSVGRASEKFTKLAQEKSAENID